MQLTNLDFWPVATPIGTFVVAAQDDAIKGGWFEGQKYFPAAAMMATWRRRETSVLRTARQELDAYFAGTLTEFTVPVAPEGTPFQRSVWSALRQVPCGATITYAGLAQAIGQPRSFHPVGAAVGRNPISLLIPCHRAVGSDGSLTGYAGGMQRKRWLLDHESREARLFA